MRVLADVEGCESAVEPARADDRHLLGERHHPLQDARRAAERAEGGGEVASVPDRRLPLAVVAEAPRLQDRRPPELGHRARHAAGRVDGDERRGPDAEGRQKLLLDKPVLARGQRRRVGPDGAQGGQHLGRARRHVFEFVGDHLDAGGECLQRRLVLVGRHRGRARDLEGGAVGVGAIHVGAQPEPRGGERQHPPELAAAENADRRPRRQGHGSSRGTRATAALCSARQAASREASASSCSASTAAARSAALIAPALPIAKVPTGTPPRHLHDRIERIAPAEVLARDRHAEHRQRRHRRRHPGQVRRAARAGDDDLVAVGLGASGKVPEPVRRAVRRDDQ